MAAGEQRQPSYGLQFSETERLRFRVMAQRARTQEQVQWTASGIIPGARVADIGCGPGAVLVELARMVGKGGHAVGVEPDQRSRAAAEEEIVAAGVVNARVVDGTGIETGLPERSFDAVMLRHVLFHVGRDAQPVVEHCASLLKPGGHLYLVDTDMEAARVDPAGAHPDVVDLVSRHIRFQRERGCNVDMGSRLGSMLHRAGLAVVQRTAGYVIGSGERLAFGGPFGAGIPAMIDGGAATPEDEQRWRAGLRALADDASAAFFMTEFVAVGRSAI